MKWQMSWPLAAVVMLGTASMPRAAETPHAPAAGSTPPASSVELGTGPAYGILGRLPMMHVGRPKPIDTVAREEIKQIYTRETIKLPGAAGQPAATWTPVAALLDWSVRPKFWDKQPIIAVEYLPLKQKIFADEVRQGLEGIASKAATPAPVRQQLLALAGEAEVAAAQIRNVVRNSGLTEEDGKTLLALAAKIGEETKWQTPEDLENAQVVVDGTMTPLMSWFDQLSRRASQMGSEAKLSDVEENAMTVANRLGHYRSIRDKEPMGMVPLLAMPRPANRAMLEYTTAAVKKIREVGDQKLGPLEYETVNLLAKYIDDTPGKDRADPGENPEFDAKYTEWLKEKSAWVPLHVVREASVEELARAGFPAAKVEAFRTAFKAVEDEELLHPGQADPQPSLALLDVAHDLGATINASRYPTVAEMDREVQFNRVAPFFAAPWAYLAGLVLLMGSLVATNFGRSMRLESVFGKVAGLFYYAGLSGFLAGMALEVFGFYLRVRITGWAPVSNMYETVIFVALMSSVLGLVIEAIYRQTYAALAAAGVAFVATLIAANVGDTLDPSIRQLPPVLRSNLWLTIHVLTIVSSYAAFALAMGLGVVATGTYLVATYKRSASLGELVAPLAVFAPLTALGGWLTWSAESINLGPLWTNYGYYVSLIPLAVGASLCGMVLFALVGEGINRVAFARHLRRALAHDQIPNPTIFTVTPELAEASPEFATDLRTKVMQHTAAQIKPMATFIYRSMQVGVLLVAAGTFLGGWWADVSWGRFWGWDPKEVWALVTLLVYLMPLHGRFAGWVNTFWLVMSSVVCFLSVLMAWYGVNFVLGVGLHSYGFSKNGGQGVVMTATLVVLSFAAGAFWRRRVSSQVVTVA